MAKSRGVLREVFWRALSFSLAAESVVSRNIAHSKKKHRVSARTHTTHLYTLWALAQVGSGPCGGFRSQDPVETLFNDFFSLNQGLHSVFRTETAIRG
jgi:hypothetical protein